MQKILPSGLKTVRNYFKKKANSRDAKKRKQWNPAD